MLDGLAEPAAEWVRACGLLPEITSHQMLAALEAEMDLPLAEEAGRTGGKDLIQTIRHGLYAPRTSPSST